MKRGVTEEMIGAVQANVMLVSAGSIYAQLRTARIEAKGGA